MADDFAERVSGVGALAEPARRGLYLYVAAQPEAVSREQAAEGCDLPPHSAKFHLDRLVDEGLLDVEFRRLSGRSGPGAGRPAKLYRRSGREVSVSLPERRYDLAGRVLAAAVERAAGGDVPLPVAVAEAAAGEGRRAVPADLVGDDAERMTAALAACGYEPRTVEGVTTLVNCPFDALAREHTELVCGMNLDFVQGVLDELSVTSIEAVLQPAPETCCVRCRPAADAQR